MCEISKTSNLWFNAAESSVFENKFAVRIWNPDAHGCLNTMQRQTICSTVILHNTFLQLMTLLTFCTFCQILQSLSNRDNIFLLDWTSGSSEHLARTSNFISYSWEIDLVANRSKYRSRQVVEHALSEIWTHLLDPVPQNRIGQKVWIGFLKQQLWQ